MIPEKPTTGRPKKHSNRSGRDRKICIRVSDIDIRKLEKLCVFYDTTKTDFIIAMIDNYYMRMKREQRKD